jgi:hypothetical protein
MNRIRHVVPHRWLAAVLLALTRRGGHRRVNSDEQSLCNANELASPKKNMGPKASLMYSRVRPYNFALLLARVTFVLGIKGAILQIEELFYEFNFSNCSKMYRITLHVLLAFRV